METKSKNKTKFISQCATLLKQGIALVLTLILFTSASIAGTTDKADSLNYKSYPQNTLIASHSSITIAAFSTININKKLAVNPFISGSIGDYYFENRYNYEAYNSASVNIGRKLDKKIAGFEITPMMGLVIGGFKGITSEIQAFHENERWYFH